MSILKTLTATSFLLFSPLTVATPFQIDFSGQLESLTTLGTPGVSTINSIFNIGDSVSGTIIVDNNNLANSSISLFDLTIGSYNATASGGFATIYNDYQAGSSAPVLDSIRITGSNFSSTSIGGYNVDRLQFAVGTTDLSTLDPSSIVGPGEIMALWNDTPNYFSGNLNYMSFDNSGADETARFALTSVTVSAVPEPSSIALFTLGVLGLGFASRRKQNI